MDKLAEAFALMDRWRHLPAYQLERRADIFFALYMKKIIEAATGAVLDAEMVPEFPLKRELIWPGRPSNQSVKVDYVLFAADRSRVFFVELKTDQTSRREEQDYYLERAHEVRFRAFVQGLVEMAQHTNQYGKYYHLLHTLARLGFMMLPVELEDFVYPQVRPGLSALFREVRVAERDPEIEVFYVQPRADGDRRCIGFDTVAGIVGRHDDDLSRIFASYLLRWCEDAARVRPAEQTYSVASVGQPGA